MADLMNLQLSLDNTNQFGVFIKAIDDPKFRAGLPKTGLPLQASQMLSMIEDVEFVNACANAARQYSLYTRGTASRTTVNAAGQQVANL